MVLKCKRMFGGIYRINTDHSFRNFELNVLNFEMLFNKLKHYDQPNYARGSSIQCITAN